MKTPEISRIYALIPKFGLEIKNRCTKEGGIGEKLASIRKFGLEIKNRCTECLRIQGFIHENGQYRGWDGAEAGTGRHGGGITLSKKPP